MSAGIYKITVEQGATYSQTFTWKINKSPVDLTSYTARMKVRDPKRQPSINQIIYLTSAANGGITLGGAAGTILINVSAVTTASLTAGKYLYDLELVSSSGFVTRLIKGQFIVSDEVTY